MHVQGPAIKEGGNPGNRNNGGGNSGGGASPRRPRVEREYRTSASGGRRRVPAVAGATCTGARVARCAE